MGNKVDSVASLLKAEEGLRLSPYRCTAGRLTIGYGRNLDDKGITADEAEFLLVDDILDATMDCMTIFGCAVWSRLSDVRKAVLCSMRFQLGPGGIRQFVGTIKAVKDGRWADAASHMLVSEWARQTPARARRAADMMSSDQWPAEW